MPDGIWSREPAGGPADWKPVSGFSGYDVSRSGDVRNARSGRLLSQHTGNDGYRQVGLMLDGRKRTKRVHRLVCAAFWGEPPEGQQVAHLDGNPANNVADNLSWATGIENHSHKRDHGTRQIGVKNGQAKFSDEMIEMVRSLSRSGFSERMIAERTGVSKTQVHRVLSGEQRND